MSDPIQEPSKNYLLTTLLGSFWNTLQFVVVLITSTTVSVLLTRHFGAESYGLFAYLTWFSSVVLLVINFGVIATIQTWVPKFYFTGDTARAAFIARKLFKVQGIILLGSMVLLVPIALVWHTFVTFPPRMFTTLMLVNFLPMFTGILDVSLSTLLVSLQRFKQAVLIYITGQALILAAAISVTLFHLHILGLLVLLGIANSTMLVLFVFAARDVLFDTKAEWQGQSQLKKIVFFSGWAYLLTLLSAVVWDKSEFFFLGKFYAGKAVAIYGIAYTLANTATTVLEPVISVFTTMLSELVAKKDWERIYLIVRLCSKYFSLILLPLISIAYALSTYVVALIYGHDFILVASIFPALLLSNALNRIFAPAWSLPTYTHELGRFVVRIAAFAPMNILLDIFLIPRYGVWGAVFANVITQVAALIYFGFFVRRYRLRLFTTEYFKVIALNVILFSIMVAFVRHEAPFLQSLAITLAALAAYLVFVYKKLLTSEDRELFFSSVRLVKNRRAGTVE